MKTLPRRSAALVITRNLPPLVGGMERLVWHIVDELRTDWDVHVIGPAGCRSHLPQEVSGSEVPIRPMYRYLLRTKLATLRQALRQRPRLVFAGSGLTAPFAWLAARLVGARCVVYLHGLDVEARHPIYRLFWRPFFRRCDQVLVNSRFTRRLALDAGVAPKRIAILHPGVSLPDLTEAAQRRAEFRERHNLGEIPLMLYVGRITARKGLADFVRNDLPAIIERVPSAKLVVIGDEPAGALLRSTGERTRIDEALKASGLEHSVEFLGERAHDDPDLDAAYFAADVSIFPVQERPFDNEGFGMVALEAAAHGLPTVAFAVGGVTDAIADGSSGDIIKPKDALSFQQKVVERIEESPNAKATRVENARMFASNFVWPTFGRKLRRLCLPDSERSS